MTRTAFIISVLDAPPKYEGEKIIAVVCPHCGEVHKHRSDALTVRQARCDPAKNYQVARW